MILKNVKIAKIIFAINVFQIFQILIINALIIAIHIQNNNRI